MYFVAVNAGIDGLAREQWKLKRRKKPDGKFSSREVLHEYAKLENTLLAFCNGADSDLSAGEQ